MEQHSTHSDSNVMSFACQVPQESGIEGAVHVMQCLLNEVMLLSRSQHFMQGLMSELNLELIARMALSLERLTQQVLARSYPVKASSL